MAIAITTGLRTIFFQPRRTTGIRFSFTNHSAMVSSTGISRTSFAIAASNACWWANVAAFFPWRARLIATRMARSIPGFSVIGAQPRRSSDLSAMMGFSSVISDGRIEPGLELPAATANVRGQVGRFHIEERNELRERKFIEIEKCERAALRFGRGRNPDRELNGIELPDLGR